MTSWETLEQVKTRLAQVLGATREAAESFGTAYGLGYLEGRIQGIIWFIEGELEKEPTGDEET